MWQESPLKGLSVYWQKKKNTSFRGQNKRKCNNNFISLKKKKKIIVIFAADAMPLGEVEPNQGKSCSKQ